MTRNDIKLFGKKLTKYAYYRMIFFGLALLALIISFDLLPQLEGVNINSMSDAEFEAFIADDITSWILLLIMIFLLAISGIAVIVLYILYVVQLSRVSDSESSHYLRNILLVELLRPVMWIIQLTFWNGMDQAEFQLLNCVSGGISIFVIIQFKTWVETFGNKRSSGSPITSLQSILSIWMISTIGFIFVSLLQGLGLFLQIIGEFNGLFLVIIECSLLLVISFALWTFGKKIILLF
ncbi:MAG: hypothetical protein ACTSWW_06890 [Promethearchaeota archaeon]